MTFLAPKLFSDPTARRESEGEEPAPAPVKDARQLKRIAGYDVGELLESHRDEIQKQFGLGEVMWRHLVGPPVPALSSKDLQTWSPDVVVVSEEQNGDGTTTITVRDSQPITSGEERYIRIRIEE